MFQFHLNVQILKKGKRTNSISLDQFSVNGLPKGRVKCTERKYENVFNKFKREWLFADNLKKKKFCVSFGMTPVNLFENKGTCIKYIRAFLS